MDTKDVALVLSSGGPRGWAYIGAIEELESRGYNITSVAGTSIGSLIGGIYAAGKLSEVKEWLFSLDAWKVFSLIDISLSKNHLVKGDKVRMLAVFIQEVDPITIGILVVQPDGIPIYRDVFGHGVLYGDGIGIDVHIQTQPIDVYRKV